MRYDGVNANRDICDLTAPIGLRSLSVHFEQGRALKPCCFGEINAEAVATAYRTARCAVNSCGRSIWPLQHVLAPTD
jgi:hypothetical protein